MIQLYEWNTCHLAPPTADFTVIPAVLSVSGQMDEAN